MSFVYIRNKHLQNGDVIHGHFSSARVPFLKQPFSETVFCLAIFKLIVKTTKALSSRKDVITIKSGRTRMVIIKTGYAVV
jgi:hypothetical protein